MSELMNYLVFLGSASTIIGVPILIQLLMRAYDERLRFLEDRSFKKIQDQLDAMQKLKTLHEKHHEMQLSKAEKKIHRITEAYTAAGVAPQVAAIASFRAQLHKLGFYYGGKRGDQFYNEALELLTAVGKRTEDGGQPRWEFLGEYERGLLNQAGLGSKLEEA